jgi:Bacteriophage lambda head decoration protein D
MNLDARINNELTRNDYPIIIAMQRHLATILPVRLVNTGADYKAGTVVGRVTATGLYKAYNDSNSDGSEVAKAILFEDVVATDVPASTNAVARGIFSGYVFKDKLVGLDAAAIGDLQAKTVTDASGVDILKF